MTQRHTDINTWMKEKISGSVDELLRSEYTGDIWYAAYLTRNINDEKMAEDYARKVINASIRHRSPIGLTVLKLIRNDEEREILKARISASY